MYTNLREKPYYLDEDAVRWVENTIAGMTVEEKIGQLFVPLAERGDEDYIRNTVETFHIGGTRYTETDAQKIYEQNTWYQKYSRIPMFIAANCEEGGNGACRQGTKVATQAECGATRDAGSAYELGRIGAKEAEALGCNWIFGPIADVAKNWRNTIVNTRSFGEDAALVKQFARAYLKGAHESNVITAVKHFPGDGVEERDQHLVMGINDMTCEEWDASFGDIYQSLIDEGLEAVMAGHIALPSYSRKLCPGMKPEEILPATLSPELITGLLREKMGFQGLVITDASHMGGLCCAMQRKDLVPGTIAAGCDMFLFWQDAKEDFGYMLEGYRKGRITEERLQSALEHILGMKAKLGLHKKFMREEEQPGMMEGITGSGAEASAEGCSTAAGAGSDVSVKERLAVIGCGEHHREAKKIADRAVTLVKDTQKLLPIDPMVRKKARLYFLESAPVSYLDGTDPAKRIAVEELEKAGFTVDVQPSYYEMETRESSAWNRYRIMEKPPVEEFKKAYDVVFVFIHMKGYAKENNVRLSYSASHSSELPWWVREVPTVFVSLGYTNHLYDLPMAKTFINAYGETVECISAAVEKITGKSPFYGTCDENVWCGSWDTRR